MLEPRTMAELMAESENYEFSTAVPYTVYLRTAKEVLRHAGLYTQQENFGDAFVLYARFLDLVLNKLPTYTTLRKDEKNYKKYNLLLKDTRTTMEKAEKLKAILRKQRQDWVAYNDEQEQHRAEEERQQKELLVLESRRSPSPVLVEARANSNDVHEFDDTQFEQHLSNFFAKHDNHKIQPPSYPLLEHTYEDAASSNDTLVAQPLLPPKEKGAPSIDLLPPQPALPPKTNGIITEVPRIEPLVPPSQAQKRTVQHKSLASTEGGKPLKTVFAPSELESSFLKVADPNTKRKLETCGILCGKLSLSAFFITTLLIPKQESTANTCNTTDEEGIFEYIDQNDLFVLGWIHTHPTQSCFLSSVDLHTQNSYQIMLPEAIAIVCAPIARGERVGVFRLTDPPGIGVITKCMRTGFHPHEEPGIYRRCNRPNKGHVVIKEGLPFKVVDLR